MPTYSRLYTSKKVPNHRYQRKFIELDDSRYLDSPIELDIQDLLRISINLVAVNRVRKRVAEEYSKLVSKTAPPIKVSILKDVGYQILDGHHRVAAAILRGDEKISALIMTVL